MVIEQIHLGNNRGHRHEKNGSPDLDNKHSGELQNQRVRRHAIAKPQ